LMLLTISAGAQLYYSFDARYEPYVPLSSGATNLSGSIPWDGDSSYYVPIPFIFKINEVPKTVFKIFGCQVMPASDTNSLGYVSGFLPTSLGLTDRGSGTGTSQSPIRYRTDGVAPRRIFKLEYANAGIFNEGSAFGSLDDYVNFQIWVYEDTNIVELRYGSAKLSYPSVYFINSLAPHIGFFDKIEMQNGSSGSFFYLKGDPGAPTLDSVAASSFDFMMTTLMSYPDSSTVYRFTPKANPSGISAAASALQAVRISPTVTNGLVMLDNPQHCRISYSVRTMSGATTNLEGSFESAQQDINLSGLASGVYYIELQAEGSKVLKELLRQ
ncbi:MAG: hypothetical protein JST21_01715, partial [Bacteroidetes bacterium]|nr:hypothetical protein [Bacteroidota bacterium]